MTAEENEKTTGGLAGKFVGKAKEAAGELLDRDELAREGRLQQAQGDAQAHAAHLADEARQSEAEAKLEAERAQTEAERARLKAEFEAEREEAAAESEQQREVARADEDADRQVAEAEADRELVEQQAGRREEQGREQYDAEAALAAKLEREADRAERRAEAIDTEEI